MSTPDPLDSAQDLTVAFELAALEELEYPARVYQETEQWATHIGILSDGPTHTITSFAHREGLELGFHSGPRSVLESLPKIRAQPELAADRYLLIGAESREAAEPRRAGWAFLSVNEAAEAAEWSLASNGSDQSLDDSWL